MSAATVDRLVAGCVARLTIDDAVEPRLVAPLVNLPPCADAVDPDLEITIEPLDEDQASDLALAELSPTGMLESSADGRVVRHRQPHCVSQLDRERRRIHARLRTSGEPASFTARPLQSLLSIVCADRGGDLVHAALVSRGGQGALIVGPGGAGKSTTAVAALLDGWDYLGDDCVAIERRDGAFIGSPVYASACLDPKHLATFAPSLTAEHADPGEKSMVALRLSARQAAHAAIRAIILPRVSGGNAIVVDRRDAKAALLALAPTSILRRAVPAAAMLARLRALVASAPCYALEMGPPERIGAHLRELVERHA